jgi:PGF-CTERM protein
MRKMLAVGLLVLLVLAPGAAAAQGQTPASTQVGDSVQSPRTDVAPASDAALPTDGPTPAASAADRTASDACEAVAGGSQRENPSSDVIGWENGCWHNDSIAVTVDDGLNETELDAVVARTMARVEYVRQLEFTKTVDVDVVSREEFKSNNADAFADVSEESRLHQDVKHEALFFVPEDRSALAQIQYNRGGSVLGYYSPRNDSIVIISDSDGPLKVDGPTLAHELAHALQDQQFDLTRYNRTTTEQDNAVNGLVEGDPTYTEHLYSQRCEAEWNCPSRDADPGGGSFDPDFDYGIYFMGFQPYADGGSFVRSLKEEGGWEAVNEAYDNPPASSEQVMYPEKYPDETPREVSVTDRSNEDWRVLDLGEGSVNYAVFGEAGMAAMFISPTYDDRSPEFITIDELFTDRELDNLDYSLPPSDGWDGDKLFPYVTDDSADTNETGYVWKTAWDSPEEATEFAEAYVAMLSYRGASEVSARQNTYRIPDEEAYGDAFYVNRTGDTVTIVNAPTVEELSNVRAGAAPEATPTPTPSETAVATTAVTEDTARETGEMTESSPEGTETSSPGFGPLVAVLALFAVALLARRR